MAMTYQIAAVGDWESVMGFRALGLDTYPVVDAAEAKEKIKAILMEERKRARREEAARNNPLRKYGG